MSAHGNDEKVDAEIRSNIWGLPAAGTVPFVDGNGQQAIWMPAFGSAFQPAPYKEAQFRKFANPAPLGFSAFAFTKALLSIFSAGIGGISVCSIVVGAVYIYGGLIMLFAGMWEMAIGNTFGATAFASYGGFWITWALIETDGLGYAAAYKSKADLSSAIGYCLAGWFIFTTLCLICTLKSTVTLFMLFLCNDITFLLFTIAYLQQAPDGSPNAAITQAAGVFGLVTSFFAWWNAVAGMLEPANSFFTIPVAHFPWSEKARNPKTEHMV